MVRALVRAATGVAEDKLAPQFTAVQALSLDGVLRRVAPAYRSWMKRKDKQEIHLSENTTMYKHDQADEMDITTMPILLRRRVEAMILKHVLDVVTERSDRAEAEAVIGEACSRSAIEQGESIAESLGHEPGFADFEAIMPAWTREDALEVEPIETTEDKMEFNVTRCRYSEMYKEMGVGDIGHLLSCNRDSDFCLGYNPKMKLTRTQTIMKGASHCDFRYRMTSED